MTSEGKDLSTQTAVQVPESDSFLQLVKRIVSQENEVVLESLEAAGAVVGKKVIERTVRK